MVARLTIATLAVLALATPALAQRDELAVLRDVQQRVLQYPNFSIFDSVKARLDDGGVLTLTGKVTMPFKRNDISTRVARVDGIQQVINEIDVLPVSQFDDSLRWRIAQAIYSNLNFQPFAAMPNPPIHVIVENGRVTLEGVVRSNVDRMLARSLVIGFPAFQVTNDLKTDAEMRAQAESL